LLDADGGADLELVSGSADRRGEKFTIQSRFDTAEVAGRDTVLVRMVGVHRAGAPDATRSPMAWFGYS
jgi:hypothetical protein